MLGVELLEAVLATLMAEVEGLAFLDATCCLIISCLRGQRWKIAGWSLLQRRKNYVSDFKIE